jgi:hypothetical protein
MPPKAVTLKNRNKGQGSRTRSGTPPPPAPTAGKKLKRTARLAWSPRVAVIGSSGGGAAALGPAGGAMEAISTLQVGLGRIVALYDRSSTSHQNR